MSFEVSGSCWIPTWLESTERGITENDESFDVTLTPTLSRKRERERESENPGNWEQTPLDKYGLRPYTMYR